MRAWLWKTFGRERVFWHGKGEDGLIDEAIMLHGAKHFDRYAVIGGHVPFSNAMLHSLPQRKIHAAILRRPEYQVVSHFAYVSQRPEHPLYAGDDLERALRERTQFFTYSSNIQTRYASNCFTAAEAWQRVFDKTPFVLGCFDQLDIFVEHIAKLFGKAHSKLSHENTQTPGYFERYYTPQAAEIIREITIEDERLYQQIFKKGVVNTTFKD